MNIRHWIYAATICIGLSSSTLFAHTVTKYVKGGICKSGNGSKKHPYNSLADAEADTSWDVLVVLPSKVALDGGIELRSGTKLIGGGNDPTDLVIDRKLPVITNTQELLHDGHGVVVNGTAEVRNIHIKNTLASAINFDNAKNLEVAHVLITGHNQGALFAHRTLPGNVQIEAAGIHGQPKQSGSLVLDRVIVRNNNSGAGVVIVPNQGAKWTFEMTNCEIADVVSRNLGLHPLTLQVNDGVYVAPCGQGTTLDAIISGSYIHDFRAATLSLKQNRGIACTAIDGAKLTIEIKDCMFSKVANGNQLQNTHIFAHSFVDTTHVSGNVRSDVELRVDSCSFEETPHNTLVKVAAVEVQTTNSNSNWMIKKSKVANLLDAFHSIINSDGREVGRIYDNLVSGGNGFYMTATQDAASHVPTPHRESSVEIKNNMYLGGTNFAAIGVIANLDAQHNPWHSLVIHVHDNCFDGQNTGFAGFLGRDLGTGGAGAATIYAHDNSIIGYNFDILDDHANVNYDVQKNWWGPSNPCSTNFDCAPSQSCVHGFCAGPDNVNNLGSGRVRDDKPLLGKTKCRHTCQNE